MDSSFVHFERRQTNPKNAPSTASASIQGLNMDVRSHNTVPMNDLVTAQYNQPWVASRIILKKISRFVFLFHRKQILSSAIIQNTHKLISSTLLIFSDIQKKRFWEQQVQSSKIDKSCNQSKEVRYFARTKEKERGWCSFS